MKYTVAVERASVDGNVNTYELAVKTDTDQLVHIKLSVECPCRKTRDDLITALSKALDACISNANNEGE